jgi:hypothetical protein
MAYQLFSDPEFFPHIGKSDSESVDQDTIRILKKSTIKGIYNQRYLPNDPDRVNAAERVAECACLMLYLHEAAHIRGCHIDIIADYFGVAEYQEINMLPLDDESSVILRALELEADTLAVINGLSIWRELTKHTDVHAVAGLEETQLWLVAAELLFWVMSMSLDYEAPKQSRTHPSLLTRELNLRMIRGKEGVEDTVLARTLEKDRHEVPRWFLKHKMSSQIISLFNDETIRLEEKASEYRELCAKLQELWPSIEKLQAARMENVSSNERI